MFQRVSQAENHKYLSCNFCSSWWWKSPCSTENYMPLTNFCTQQPGICQCKPSSRFQAWVSPNSRLTLYPKTSIASDLRDTACCRAPKHQQRLHQLYQYSILWMISVIPWCNCLNWEIFHYAQRLFDLRPLLTCFSTKNWTPQIHWELAMGQEVLYLWLSQQN